MVTFSVTIDTCYVLAYAIIMLNTSLHNPSVKNKVMCSLSLHLIVVTPAIAHTGELHQYESWH